MKYCLYVREDLALMGRGFFDQPEINGMKSDTYMYRDLKNFLASHNIRLETQQINPPEESEVIICLNETAFFLTYERKKINRLLVLILTEPPVYNLADWSKERHLLFDRVFTYDSDLVKSDPARYRHIHFPIAFPGKAETALPGEKEFAAKKLASLVAGAISITRSSVDNHSLLYERYKVLKWYHATDPTALDFYSRTSPLNKFEYFRGASFLNRVSKTLTGKIAAVLFRKRIAKVYRGAIPALDKNSVLGRYKFNFCLENSYGIRGLISEKIFDCFAGKTIPVYLGAPDITDYIPKECYVLYSDFKSQKALNRFLNQMDYNTYIHYLMSADKFLNSPAADVFTTNHFINKICREIK